MTAPGGGFEIGKAFISVGLRAGGAVAALGALQVAGATAGAALAALPALAASVGTSAVIMGNSISAVSDAVEAHSKAITKDRVAEIVATQGVTKEMAKYLAALEQMGPAQQKVTKQVIAMQDAWDELLKSGNEPFMQGVSTFLEDADDLFPVLQEHLRDTGRVLGGLAEDFGELFASQEFQANLDAYLDNTEQVTEAIGDSLLTMTDSVVRFGAEMDQSAEGFAGFVGSVSSGLDGFLVELAEHDADFQRIWAAWGDIVDAVLPALGEAIGNMAEAIAPVFESIGDFLQSNKEVLGEWVTGLLSLGAAILGLKAAGSMVAGLTRLGAAIGGVSSAAWLATARVGLLAVAVGGLAYAYADAQANLDDISKSLAAGSLGMEQAEQQVRALDQAWSSTRWTDTIDSLFSLQSIHFDTIFGDWRPFGEEVDKTAERLAAVTAEAERLRAEMTPLELAQQRTADATQAHADAVRDFGEQSPQAVQAQQDLSTATNEEEAAQLAAKRATQDHTDALRAQQDQMLAMSDANLAQRQATLDLKQAQEEVATAVREHGAASDEAEQAQIRFEQAQNRVITATQRQSQVAGEGRTATDQARIAADQFTYANVTLAATLGENASPAVQQFVRDLSDTELQALNAATKTAGFHYEVRTLPDGRTVYIRTDPETGEVINYREELLRIPPVVSIRVTADGKYSISSNGIKVNNVTGDVIGVGKTGLADGGVLPGYTPGRDVHLFRSDTGGELGLSGGEAVMRPEWTSAVGKARVDAWNAAARRGGVNAVARAMGAGDEDMPRFAAGGIYQYLPPMAKDQANDLISTQSAHLAREVGSALDKLFGAGGAAGALSGAGGYRWQMDVLRRIFPGLALISGYRPGAITATGNRSYHASGRAVDVPPRMDVFNWIRANYGASSKELIYSPAGGRQMHNGQPHVYTGVTRANHWDHVHWAYDQGGPLYPGTTVAQNNTGRPELVLTQDQLSALGGGGVTINGSVTVQANDPDEFLRALQQKARRGPRRMAGGRA